MNADAKRWRACPWLRELVRQWHAARGAGEPGDFQRPFSRDWESLLEATGQLSAEARSEAYRDARALEAEAVVELKTDKYRPYQIERVVVPFSAEPRLGELFADELPTKRGVTFDPESVPWVPELQFLRTARMNIAAEDLLKLNAFFQEQAGLRPVVPIKERSLQIFGDEKRLDALLTTALFRHDRLTLDALRCELIGEPLGWRRGPPTAADKPLLVIENAATWHSYCRWNGERGLFSAVVYGKGFQTAASVGYLADIFGEIGGMRPVHYFGDVDPPGLQIPQQASAYAGAHGLPPVEPHMWSYRQLLSLGADKQTKWDGEAGCRDDCAWLGELANEAWKVLSAGNRLAQERVGWEFLASAYP